MSLAPGIRLGPYEIVAVIGAGGMGEVYRAKDTRLGRDVAVKILPPSFATDPERVARFQREATVLASLNHQNIAHIYGLEQSGEIRAIVLELVEGLTLADRIAQGPIPIDEALPIARQIADALEAAHEQGIIHRDLKPANIKIRPDGAVKVLDFGLAKALLSDASAANVSMSPTITSPVMTGQGVILGSAAYMSPEQARGKAVDRRSDVWAFGCVLYEMLTGRRAFEGEEVTDVLAFIITKEPDFAALPAKTPQMIRRLLARSLAKDRKKRLADISDARLEIDEAIATPEVLPSAIARTAPAPRRALVYAAAAGIACAALTGIIVWRIAGPAPAAERPLQKLTIQIPASATYLGGNGGDLAVSRDGTRLVYAAMESGRRILYIRYLAELEPQPIRGSEDGHSPFFSPDGEWVGFFTEPAEKAGKLKKVPVRGGLAIPLCDAPSPHGGAWLDEATIIFSARGLNRSNGGLFKVPAAGGQSVPLTTLDPKTEARHGWPDVLPDGKSILFSILPRAALYDSGRVVVHSLVDGSTKTIVPSGYHGRYMSSGHIVYLSRVNAVNAGNLVAVPFDIDGLRTTGAAVQVVEAVMNGPRTVGSAGFGVSRAGFLAYAPGGVATRRSLVWVDRRGREEPIGAPARPYVYARLSPDGTRVVLDVRDEQNDLWVWSLARQTLVRVTKDPGIDRFPVWSADSSRVLFSSLRTGTTDNIYSQSADGTGEAERLIESQVNQVPLTVTADGSQLIFREGAGAAGIGSLKLLTLRGNRTVLPLMQPPAAETNAELSPDGKWLAYQSAESGGAEVYVRPFPNVNSAKFLVSTGGGSRPLWARNGRELFYVSGTITGPLAVMAVPVQPGATFSAGIPRKLFEGRYAGLQGALVARSYDVSLDGAKFLMIKDEAPDASSTQSAFVILLNFFDQLKRLAPPNP